MKDEALEIESPDRQIEIDRIVELRAMANMLRRSQGFVLAFAQCNQPAERSKLVSELRRILDDYTVAEVEFANPVDNLLDELIPQLPEHKNAHALFIYGLERSISSEREFSPMVANLNVSRNLFPRHISCPMVLWLPTFAITAVMRGAPDFFSWRSAIFQFPSPIGAISQISQDALTGDAQAAINLTLEEKQDRIAVIENLLADYESLPSEKRDRTIEGDLLHRLGILHHAQSRYEDALRYYNESLSISQRLGDQSGVAVSLHSIGMIHYAQGRYEDALKYYNESLSIKQKLGDQSGVAYSLHNIGLIHQVQGRYEDALKYYNDSLSISQRLGDQSGVAYSLHSIGMIHQDQGRYEDALKYYNDSLSIKQKLGDQSGVAMSLHQIGMIHHAQSRYEDALRYYNESLSIKQKLGDQSGVAKSLHNIGIIHQDQDRSEDAIKYILRAFVIFQSLGSPDAQIADNVLSGIRQQIGAAEFERILQNEKRKIEQEGPFVI